MISASAQASGFAGGIHHAPQSATHQSQLSQGFTTNGVIQGQLVAGLGQSNSSGALPKIGQSQAAVQGICDQMVKSLQINTGAFNINAQSSIGATGVPANKENNTKKLPQIANTDSGTTSAGQTTATSGISSGIIGGHRASSGNGSSGQMQLSYNLVQSGKPGLMQHHHIQQRGREFGRELQNANSAQAQSAGNPPGLMKMQTQGEVVPSISSLNGSNVHQASGMSQKRAGEIIMPGSATAQQAAKMVSLILFSKLKF